MTDDTQTLGLIPDQLLSDIKKGDCVLFLGADLPLGYEGAPLSRPELAAALAEKHGLPPGLPWPETAQAYLGKFTGDRHGLISFVAEHCSDPNVRPGPLHEAIARAGFRAIVTAWYDDLLEVALRDAGYRVNRVVHDTELPYAHEREREAIVIKLYGCLSDPKSLVLDTWDHAQLMSQLSRKLKLVTAFCSIRPPLFVGFDLTNHVPIQLYVHASAEIVEQMRRAYAVWPHPLDAVQAAWRGKNVEFRRADAVAFLQTLAGYLPVVGPSVRRAIRVQRPPYKFLDYYEPEDTDIFCGRDTESQIATRLALSYRLLTLFGPSGAGKTSLLLAGVLPRLASEGYKHVYVRALDDPLTALRKEVATLAGRDEWQTGADLRTFLKTMLAAEEKLIVILDQFEEVFQRVGSGKRATLFQELAAALVKPEREVRVIFSLREDYLAYLDEARDDLPDIFINSFRLRTLDRGNARVAITEPAARASVIVEAALVDDLVGSTGRETEGKRTGDLVEADGYVPPAVLQIVLDRLYREALPSDYPPDAPPPSNLILTLDTYRSIRHQVGEEEEAKELQGAEAILAGYVDEGLARLPDLKHEDSQTLLGADPELGEAILKAMVTSQATKAALTQAEILGLLDEAGIIQADDAADQKLVENTRLGLERVRLLRGFERGGVAFYELAHDHLASEVGRRIGEAEMRAKLARELLRREVDNWHEANLLIRQEVLALIHEQRDDLRRLSAEELELLFRSALDTGYEIAYWTVRAAQAGVAVNEIVLAELKSTDFRVRAAAATALGRPGNEAFMAPLTEVLSDDYPQVRIAAIAALEQLAPSGEWRKELKYECYVPTGKSIMGEDRESHEVFIEAFYIGKYPVTNAEYKRYRDDIGRTFTIPEGKVDHPVANINWYDARDYAAWAGMRLLTEAEWEKAASWEETKNEGQGAENEKHLSLLQLLIREPTGKKRPYPWGEAVNKTECNVKGWGPGDTSPVGQYSPGGDSPYGCADMAGNVLEWCSSLHKPYPYRAGDGREDMAPRRVPRILRGGSFDDRVSSALCTFRNPYPPDVGGSGFGFRVGWSPTSKLTSDLLEYLKSADAPIRVATATELGKLGNEVFIAPLTEMLSDSNVKVLVAVIHALARLAPAGAWQQELQKVLQSTDARVRAAALAELEKMLSDSNVNVLVAAIHALARLAPDGAWQQELQKVLQSADARVRSAALTELEKTLSDSDINMLTTAIHVLARLAPAGAWHQELQKVLQSTDAGVRAAAIAELEKMLSDSDINMLTAAIHALAGLAPDGTWQQELQKVLQSADAGVRAAVVAELGRLGNEASIGLLTEMLSDPDVNVLTAGISALAGLAPDGAWQQELQKVLQSADAGVRATAIAELDKLGIDSSTLVWEEEIPQWLRILREEGLEEPTLEDMPTAEEVVTEAEAKAAPAEEEGIPTWLRILREEGLEEPTLEEAPAEEVVAEEEEIPAWLRILREEGLVEPTLEEIPSEEIVAEAEVPEAEVAPAKEEEIPVWLRILREEGLEEPTLEEAPAEEVVAEEEEIPAWLRILREEGLVEDMAREGLQSDDFRTRTAAAIALGQLGERFVEPIIGMLADEYLQVRVAAITALERLRPDGAWREHLKYECYIPAGEFVVGDDSKDLEGMKITAHKVYVDAFYIGKYPVTNADYKRYMDDIGRAFEVPAGKTDHPVVHLSWYDACDYATWAEMRLPTEAEWEKAASWDERTGKKWRYPWGDMFDTDKCNTAESRIGNTTPVSKYSPKGDSSYGCADMVGNVWEWTNSLYYQVPGYRVVRGGSFVSNHSLARCASRYRLDQRDRYWLVGFRVAVSPRDSRR